MKISIHSFESIQRRSLKPFTPHTSLISIGDPDGVPPRLHHKPEHYIRVKFDDMTRQEACERLNLQNPTDEELQTALKKRSSVLFSDETAQKLAEFILKHAPHTDVFICQCEFGQSRSAACAAAIAQHFGKRGHIVFEDKRYAPNMLVYEKLLEALEKA